MNLQISCYYNNWCHIFPSFNLKVKKMFRLSQSLVNFQKTSLSMQYSKHSIEFILLLHSLRIIISAHWFPHLVTTHRSANAYSVRSLSYQAAACSPEFVSRAQLVHLGVFIAQSVASRNPRAGLACTSSPPARKKCWSSAPFSTYSWPSSSSRLNPRATPRRRFRHRRRKSVTCASAKVSIFIFFILLCDRVSGSTGASSRQIIKEIDKDAPVDRVFCVPETEIDCANRGLDEDLSDYEWPQDRAFKVVSFANNRITRVKQFPNATVEKLVLSNNSIVKIDLRAFGNLVNLTVLDLSYNRLTHNNFTDEALEVSDNRNLISRVSDSGISQFILLCVSGFINCFIGSLMSHFWDFM